MRNTYSYKKKGILIILVIMFIAMSVNVLGVDCKTNSNQYKVVMDSGEEGFCANDQGAQGAKTYFESGDWVWQSQVNYDIYTAFSDGNRYQVIGISNHNSGGRKFIECGNSLGLSNNVNVENTFIDMNNNAQKKRDEQFICYKRGNDYLWAQCGSSGVDNHEHKNGEGINDLEIVRSDKYKNDFLVKGYQDWRGYDDLILEITSSKVPLTLDIFNDGEEKNIDLTQLLVSRKGSNYRFKIPIKNLNLVGVYELIFDNTKGASTDIIINQAYFNSAYYCFNDGNNVEWATNLGIDESICKTQPSFSWITGIDNEGRAECCMPGKKFNNATVACQKGVTILKGECVGGYEFDGTEIKKAGACCGGCETDGECAKQGEIINDKVCTDGSWVLKNYGMEYDYDSLSEYNDCGTSGECFTTKTVSNSKEVSADPDTKTTAGNCVSSGEVVDSYICESGKWKSQIKDIAQRLYSFAETNNGEYSLFCSDGANIEIEDGSNLDNYCVLDYYDSGNKNRLIGTYIKEDEIPTLTGMNDIDCNEVYDFDECYGGTKTDKVFYDKRSKGVIFTKQSETSVSGKGLVTSAINLFSSTWDFIRGSDKFTFSDGLVIDVNFERLYIAKKGANKIFAYGDSLNKYALFRYDNIAFDMCEYVKLKGGIFTDGISGKPVSCDFNIVDLNNWSFYVKSNDDKYKSYWDDFTYKIDLGKGSTKPNLVQLKQVGLFAVNNKAKFEMVTLGEDEVSRWAIQDKGETILDNKTAKNTWEFYVDPEDFTKEEYVVIATGAGFRKVLKVKVVEGPTVSNVAINFIPKGESIVFTGTYESTGKINSFEWKRNGTKKGDSNSESISISKDEVYGWNYSFCVTPKSDNLFGKEECYTTEKITKDSLSKVITCKELNNAPNENYGCVIGLVGENEHAGMCGSSTEAIYCTLGNTSSIVSNIAKNDNSDKPNNYLVSLQHFEGEINNSHITNNSDYGVEMVLLNTSRDGVSFECHVRDRQCNNGEYKIFTMSNFEGGLSEHISFNSYSNKVCCKVEDN